MKLDKYRDIPFTLDECKNLADHIELTLFETIRNDPDIDNIEWLVSIMSAYTKLVNAAEILKEAEGKK